MKNQSTLQPIRPAKSQIIGRKKLGEKKDYLSNYKSPYMQQKPVYHIDFVSDLFRDEKSENSKLSKYQSENWNDRDQDERKK